MKGVLILENGQKFYGNMLMDEPAVGEVVFNTGMTGYQETFTDPSYAGQIITMTYPLIGNYGLFHEIEQADRPYAAGFIVSELCEEPSNWQNEGKLSTFIMTHHIPCLYGVDTRAITRAIRSQGVMKGVIVPETMEESAIKELFDTPLETQLVRRVTTREIKHMGDGRFHVAVMDYGAKANILRELVNSDCRLTIFPAETKAEEVLAVNPDGIFLSNGPGDPADLTVEIDNIKKMIGKKPIFGICMGHQVMALANGAKTKKMLFGHRGINQPVRDLVDHKICITSQNHGFMVDEDSLKGLPIEVINRSLNDNTIEGLRYLNHPTFTVQYHPEASPGPSGNAYLFDRFIKMMGGH